MFAFENSGLLSRYVGLRKNEDKAPRRAQRISCVFERRGDIANTNKWVGWRVANLRPLFEPILWFQKPYKTGSTLADNLIKHEVGAWNENSLTFIGIYNRGALNHSNILKVMRITSEDKGYHVCSKTT